VSKGLGQIERAVLNVLKEMRYDNRKPEIPVVYLAKIVYKIDPDKAIPRSQYTTVCRAVKRLEHKNYIKTEFRNGKTLYFDATRYKIVMIGPRMYEEKEWLNWYKRWDVTQ
jgi:hypothetical protein